VTRQRSARSRPKAPALDVLSKADPPEHTGYRSVVNRSFSAQSVKKLEPRLQEIANSLLDACIGAGFVSQFAKPFPLYVFAAFSGDTSKRNFSRRKMRLIGKSG
jgi:cytochrome P450